ncbi:MAG: hypothetical protein ACM3TN_19050 [Alphaproteobacteria bacterium]|jgi:hypothetical protein
MTLAESNKEWNLLKQQFDELVHDEARAADSIEDVFDAEFRRRFVELINHIASKNENPHARWFRHGSYGMSQETRK